MSNTPLSDKYFGTGPHRPMVLSEVETRPIDWLWHPYIPRKAVTLIVGDGGYGKSWMTCAIAADLSMGRALPGAEAKPPQRILMISAEDGMAEIIKPKMEQLDADMSNISVIDEGFVIKPAIVKTIIEWMREFDAAVVFLDPLVVYIGGAVDLHKANETREIMAQLTATAKDTNTAVVAVHHVRKQSGGNNLQHKTLGSVDLVNGVRSVLLAEISPGGQRYMKHVKHNWSAEGPTLAYNFDGQSFAWSGLYTGETDDSGKITVTKRGNAKGFLISILKDGPVASADIINLAQAEGIPYRTLNRAKIGIARSFQKKDGWYWELEAPALEKVAEEKLAGVVQQPPTYRSPEEAEALLRKIGRGNGSMALAEVPETPKKPPAKAQTAPTAPLAPPPGLDPAILAAARAALAAKPPSTVH